MNMVTATPSSFSTIDSICQLLVRTTPCAGAFESSALPRNQGKQIGIPPRIAWPSSQRDLALTKSTSSLPAGFQEVTWAPCRYISPWQSGALIRTLSSPALPSQIPATPGIPRRRFSSSNSEVVVIFFFEKQKAVQKLRPVNSIHNFLLWRLNSAFRAASGVRIGAAGG